MANKILTIIKELSENNTDEELREAHAIVFDVDMRMRTRGKEHKRTELLLTIIRGLINLKALEE